MAGSLSVAAAAALSSTVPGLCDEVVLVETMNGCSELLKAFHIGVGYAAGVVGCEAEHELGTTAYGFGVDVEQFVDGVEGAFVIGMPEPVVFAEGRVGFDRTPAKVAGAVDYVPVLVGDGAGFGADPADVGVFVEGDVGEDEGVGLVGAELLDDFVEVVGATGAACPVEPELGEWSVAGGEFVELGEVVLVVGGGVGVARVVAVPGREIDAEAEAGFVGGVGGHADEVAFAVEPGAFLYGVFGLLAGPEGETVVVLGDEDRILCACGFCGLHPLVGVDVRGIEDGGVGGAVAPLAVEEGVGGEVDDDADFEVLPGCLGGGGFDVDEVLGA